MVRDLRSVAVLVLGVVALLIAQPSAQEVSIRTHPYQPPSAVLRAETDLVETPLTVRDANGHTVGGLHASDFEVLDNGVAQAITGFSELRAGDRSPSSNPPQSQDGPATVAASERTEPRYIEFFFDDLHTYNRDGPVTQVPAGVEFLKRGAREFIGRGEKRLAARAAMDAAVLSADTLRDVAAAVTLAGGVPRNGAVPVSISINVDVNRLQFAAGHGRHAQQLVFIMALLDRQGGFVTGKESMMDPALTDAKLAELKKDGLKVAGTLEAPPGVYRVRTVVREGMSGRLAADSAVVQLRGPK